MVSLTDIPKKHNKSVQQKKQYFLYYITNTYWSTYQENPLCIYSKQFTTVESEQIFHIENKICCLTKTNNSATKPIDHSDYFKKNNTKSN